MPRPSSVTGAFAVFVIDVNGLKEINDTYGHSFGNDLIIAVSQVAVEVFGQDVVYRIGGDEFAVILRDADRRYENVFERADEKMYMRKMEMKSRGENSMVFVTGGTV